MAINIVVEDGSGVANANSFVSIAQAIEYAANRGVTLQPGDPTAILLIKAMDWLRDKEWLGDTVYQDQILPFPREGVRLKNGREEFPDDAVPAVVAEAQIRLAMEIFKGIDLTPTVVGGSFVKREKIGPLETEYSEAVNNFTIPQIPYVTGLIEPFLAYVGGFSLRTERV